MTYFNLRKHEPQPDAEPVEEDIEEAGEEPEEDARDAKEKAAPATWGAALWCGISGPSVWLTARTNIEASLILHLFLLWALGAGGGWIAAGIVTLWLVAVLAFIPPEYKDRLVAWIERLYTPRPARSQHPAQDPIVPLLWHLIADAPGTHLKTVTAHLQKAAPKQPLDKDAVRAHLTALQITVKPSVRDAAGKVNEGVHRADLKAWEEALSPTVPGAPPDAPAGPVATALTSSVGTRRAPIATPLSALRRLLPRGVR